MRCSAVGTEKSVRCSEFRGGRFSEVANVLYKRDFQSVTAHFIRSRECVRLSECPLREVLLYEPRDCSNSNLTTMHAQYLYTYIGNLIKEMNLRTNTSMHNQCKTQRDNCQQCLE